MSRPRIVFGAVWKMRRESDRFFCALTSRQRELVLPERGGERFLLLSLERPQVLLEALQTRQ